MIIGDKNTVGFEINKISDAEHITELKIYINGNNICEWKDLNDSKIKTVTWNIDGLINYLYGSINFLHGSDPFPFVIDGDCAAELENNARDYETDDGQKMDDYYDLLNEWSYRHSWDHERNGAIVPDIMFRRVDQDMEISWWTDQDDEGRIFTHRYGYILLPGSDYEKLITDLFNAYNAMWNIS